MIINSGVDQYLLQALKLAEIRRGFTAPNPPVGAVIVKNNQILAEGYHYAAGHPHAEIEALKQLTSEEIQDATLYVTLEPCCHQGKTPPCVDAIIGSGITAVYYGIEDPNPKVSGQGKAKLQAAGIHCQELSLPAITQFYTSYVYWQKTGFPYITPKLAISLDGKIAAAGGKPAAITSSEANGYTHELRKQAHAILTTARTVINDNPRMNVRLDQQVYPKHLYVLDQHLQTPLTAQIFTTASSVTLFHQPSISNERKGLYESKAVRCVPVSMTENKLNLQQVLKHIGMEGHFELSAETGGECFRALLKTGLVPHAFIYVAPQLLGTQAMPAFSTEENIFAQAKRVKWQMIGRDALCELEF